MRSFAGQKKRWQKYTWTGWRTESIHALRRAAAAPGHRGGPRGGAEDPRFDEPTSALDPEGIQEFYRLVGSLNREYGLTVVVAEHHLEAVLPYAKRFVLLDGGQIVSEGTPEEVMRCMYKITFTKKRCPTFSGRSSIWKKRERSSPAPSSAWRRPPLRSGRISERRRSDMLELKTYPSITARTGRRFSGISICPLGKANLSLSPGGTAAERRRSPAC